ncbi:MAG: peroxiredoxin family protein [Proteobacteria bacterium]|nr:peroxiredoxin family protein [Pseudomonadota bacterium]
MQNPTNSQAVPFELLDSQGNWHRSGDYAGSWLLLVFHRHLG